MAELTLTPGTIFVLIVVSVLLVLAVRRIFTRGLCDSHKFCGDDTSSCSSGGCSCSGCSAMSDLLSSLEDNDDQHPSKDKLTYGESMNGEKIVDTQGK